MNNLRNLRKEKGLTLPEIHRMTGIPLRSLEEYDANRIIISHYHRIKELSKVIGCTMDELMLFEDKCIYDRNEAYVCMYDVEGGVAVIVLGVERWTVTRKESMEILQRIKKKSDLIDVLDET